MKKGRYGDISVNVKKSYHDMKISKLSKIILLFFFGIGIICTIYFIFNGAHIIFNSDTATANLLAREQLLVGQLFPRNWIYVQDIWTIFINVPMIFLSMLIKNQLMLRSTAVLIQTIFYVIILIWFSRKILKNNSWILYCAILFAGMSDYYLENMFGQAAYEYIMIWVLSLVFFGLLSINEDFTINNKPMIIFFILLFVSSIGGIRYVGSFLVPFLFSVCLVYYIDNQSLLNEYIIKHLINFIKWVAIVFIATILGLILFKNLTEICGYNAGLSNPMILSGYQYEDIFNSARAILPSLWILMGFDFSVPLFSLQGVFSIVKMVATIAFVFVFPILCTIKYTTLNVTMKRFILFCWFSFIITVVLFIVVPNMGGIAAARYFQVTVVLQLIISSYYIYTFMLNKNILTAIISMVAIILFIVGSLVGMVKASQNEKELLKPTYDLIDVLRQKGLTFGYAGYWDAYRLSVFADFNPEIVAALGDPVSPKYYLSSSRWYSDEYYQGKTFLLLDEASYNYYLVDRKLEKQFGKEEEFFQYDKYYIYVYDYNIASKFINRIIAIGEKKFLLNFMRYNEYVEKNTDNSLNLKKNGIIYGPYISVPMGNYILQANYNFADESNKPVLNITADSGNVIIKQIELKNGENKIDFSLDNDMENVEFTVYNNSIENILLKEISIEKIK